MDSLSLASQGCRVMRTLLIQCHLELQLDEILLQVVPRRGRYTFYGGMHVRHRWKKIDQLEINLIDHQQINS